MVYEIVQVTNLELTHKIPDGFVPRDPYPTRSPLAMAEAMIPFVKGRIFCDVGCSAGDIAEYLVPYAKKSYGLECNKEAAQKAQGRNFELIRGRWPKAMPDADVYYVWNKFSVRLANSLRGTGKTLIAGGRMVNTPPEVCRSLCKLHKLYGAVIYEFDINEIVQLNEGSRMRPNMWRRRWNMGVLENL